MLIEVKSPLRKALPGNTILAANDRKPTADSSSGWIVALFRRSLAVVLALASLSGGILACMRMLSNSIPRNSVMVP